MFLLLVMAPGLAMAQTIQVVAFGDSITAGVGRGPGKTGVSQSQAYPARLEGALRARGWNVSVANAGIPGNRTTDALGRIDSAVPAGTRLTIIQFGGNDRFLDHASPAAISANLAQLARAVRAKGSEVIIWSPWAPGGYTRGIWGNAVFRPGSNKTLAKYDSGDGEHPNAAGHQLIAATALPDVERVLRRMGLKPGR
jgi:acyl-CoA thioesterase-1